MSEKVEVECPNCKTKRDIKGTEERVRCSNKETCGMRFYVAKNIVPKEVKKKDKKQEIRTFDGTKKEVFNLDLEKFNGSLESLIIAMNYAINTIKNKKPVIAKDINSTWYQHFLSWTKWRKAFQLGLENQ